MNDESINQVEEEKRKPKFKVGQTVYVVTIKDYEKDINVIATFKITSVEKGIDCFYYRGVKDKGEIPYKWVEKEDFLGATKHDAIKAKISYFRSAILFKKERDKQIDSLKKLSRR